MKNQNLRILQFAIASCFIFHGVVAIQSSGVYFSEWNNWIQSLVGSGSLRFVLPKYFLRTVGLIDILTGLGFLLYRVPRPALLWAIGWGFATALSRLYFLSALAPPYWQNLGRPLAECLIRLPNGILPLVFLCVIRPTWAPAIIERIKVERLVQIAIFSLLGAVLLRYLVQVNFDFIYFELEKNGMPIWYFHVGGFLAGSAVLLFLFARFFRPSWMVRAALVGVCAFLMPAAFETWTIHFNNGGPLYAAIRLGEHFPLYYVLGCSLETA